MVQTPAPNETFFGLDITDAKKSFKEIRRKLSKRYFLIEFGSDSLTYGEAKVINDQVFYNKVNRILIDQSAIERGTPTDCSAMATFISEIIEEENIWAHRVAITLPPEASLSRIINLPNRLNYHEAIEFVGNPSKSGFQFPISLEQTDFDLLPINCIPENKEEKTKAFFLNSVPKKLIDNVIKMIENAGLELHVLDVAYSSLERLADDNIKRLKTNQVLFILELTSECTHIYIYSNCGPIHVKTLAAIRNFEIPDNYEGNMTIEEATINSEQYLAISSLDLKVLFNELKKEIYKFKSEYEFEIEEILLSGINSCHPEIQHLFENRFNIKTTILRSLSLNSIGDLKNSNQICKQELNRLSGLGLSMISVENFTNKELYISSNKLELNNEKQSNKNKNKNKKTEHDSISDIKYNDFKNKPNILNSSGKKENIKKDKLLDSKSQYSISINKSEEPNILKNKIDKHNLDLKANINKSQKIDSTDIKSKEKIEINPMENKNKSFQIPENKKNELNKIDAFEKDKLNTKNKISKADNQNNDSDNQIKVNTNKEFMLDSLTDTKKEDNSMNFDFINSEDSKSENINEKDGKLNKNKSDSSNKISITDQDYDFKMPES
tara:strand:+ start:4812 stop:6641 length:1830 start_codon:yes stop_codon:yes gene_type:complete